MTKFYTPWVNDLLFNQLAVVLFWFAFLGVHFVSPISAFSAPDIGAWGSPELVDTNVFGFRESHPSTLIVGANAAVAYVKSDPAGYSSLMFAERQGGVWNTTPILQGVEAAFPISADAVTSNGIPYVGTIINRGGARDARIYSRLGGMWQSEFEDNSLVMGDPALQLARTANGLIGAYADNATIARQNNIGIVEKAGATWATTNPHADINLGIDFISVGNVANEPMILLSQGENARAAYVGRKSPPDQWSFPFATPRNFARLDA
jgi:hypothetical protein